MLDNDEQVEDRAIDEVIIIVLCMVEMATSMAFPPRFGQVQGIEVSGKDHFPCKVTNGSVGWLVALPRSWLQATMRATLQWD